MTNDLATVYRGYIDCLLICEPPFVAARLEFYCTPISRFLGLDVDRKQIRKVWSVIDKAAIERQLH